MGETFAYILLAVVVVVVILHYKKSKVTSINVYLLIPRCTCAVVRCGCAWCPSSLMALTRAEPGNSHDCRAADCCVGCWLKTSRGSPSWPRSGAFRPPGMGWSSSSRGTSSRPDSYAPACGTAVR